MGTQIETTGTSLSVPQQLNKNVLAVIGKASLDGFEKAYLIANATQRLKALLNPEYMKPIMALQGSRLGFKTDKDKDNGYPEPLVKNCLIEAVLMGVQPHGNQFNIIAGNTYITKEGFGYLLSNYKGLSYEIISDLPRINPANTSAAIVMNINWTLNGGERKERKIEIPVKMNKFMGTDAVIGKATRKARAWLYNTLSGSEISDGDIQDLDNGGRMTIPVDMSKVEDEKSDQNIIAWIKKSTTIAQLEKVEKEAKTSPHFNEYQEKYMDLFNPNTK